MDNIWVINDPENKLDKYVLALRKSPFQESVSAFFLSTTISKLSKVGVIKYGIELDGFLKSRTQSTVTISNEAILAIVNLSIKLNLSLLIAHTHPPIRLFPKSFGVYDDGGFSKDDLLFNDSVNQLFIRKSKSQIPIYYLVSDENFYCALAYYQNEYFYVSIPELEEKKIKQSDWKVQYE